MAGCGGPHGIWHFGDFVSAPVTRLIYHPRRECRRFGGTTVYFDSASGNQDPYVWNDSFLHSYCHITQFHSEVGDVNLWVSGDHFPEFSRLYCDLVFVVAQKYPWADANDLSRCDPVVDSDEAWADHYRWYAQHPLKRRSRFTLKAHTGRSFQPQEADGSLIDIAPLLQEHHVSLDALRAGMRAGTSSQPVTIPDPAGEAIVKRLSAAVTLDGQKLRAIRRHSPDLESPGPGQGDQPSNPVPQGSRHGAHCGC